MITTKDRVEQFKRDLRSLEFNKKRMNEINDDLIRLNRVMHEPKAIKYGERSGGNPVNYLELMDKEEKLTNQLKLFSMLVENTKSRLASLPEDERELLEIIYVDRSSFSEVANSKFMSIRTLKYKVNKIIRKIV